MLTAGNTGALVQGAPDSEGTMATKAKSGKVIRGVYVRGVPRGEGEILRVPEDISGQEFAELKAWNYIEDAAPADVTEANRTDRDEADATERAALLKKK